VTLATTKTNKLSKQDSSTEAILEEIDREVSNTRAESAEIDLLLKQSEGEVEKLTQRNATINAHLQQVQGQIERVPAKDIRVAYDAALDAQQRLAVMRGQMEKLQSERKHLAHTLVLLEKVRDDVRNQESEGPGKRGPNISAEIMTQAQEAERQKLSRQMHDGPAQALSNFILQTEIALRLFQVDQQQARDELNSLKATAMSTFQKIRDFIFDLRPMMLDDLGLVPTIKRYATYLSEKIGTEVNVTISGSERQLEHYLEVIVFRALQELLSNSALHSQATILKVQLDLGDRQVRASVEDNGRGFDVLVIPDEAELTVKAIRERMDMLGGSFELDSVPGQGTRITFTLPVGMKPIAT
jgi:two-component system sensor histidine kinase DegS